MDFVTEKSWGRLTSTLDESLRLIANGFAKAPNRVFHSASCV